MEALAANGYEWFTDFSSVDLMHDLFGLEVCGIPEEEDAVVVLAILEEVFPEWPYSDIHYHDYDRDRGWKALIFKNPRPKKSFTTA